MKPACDKTSELLLVIVQRLQQENLGLIPVGSLSHTKSVKCKTCEAGKISWQREQYMWECMRTYFCLVFN